MKTQAYWSWIDGEITMTPSIDALSGGVQHGYGVFETLYFNEKLKLWDLHLKRLMKSTAFYGLECPLSERELKRIILDLLSRNNLCKARVRVSVIAKDTSYLSKAIPSIITISTESYERTSSSKKLGIIAAKEIECPLNRVKSTSYSGYQLARRQALNEGFDDALLLDSNSNIIECTTANIVFYQDGKWITPSLKSSGLKGIQLMTVQTAMKKIGLELHSEDIRLKGNSFAFVCNSLIGIQEVSHINNERVKDKPSSYLSILGAWEGLEI